MTKSSPTIRKKDEKEQQETLFCHAGNSGEKQAASWGKAPAKEATPPCLSNREPGASGSTEGPLSSFLTSA